MPPHVPSGEPPSRLASSILPATGVVTILLAAFLLWFSDFVTLQGERTIHTAECMGGEWHDDHCTGHLAAGPRYRFRALRTHQEVLFWTAGASGSSRKFSNCTIQDGRNWSCPPNEDAKETITLQMEHGRAAHDASGHTRPFHAVEKWRWLLLRAGVYAGNSADY